MLTYFLWPRASYKSYDIAVQSFGSLPKGLMGTFVNLNRTEGMLNVADAARPDILSHLVTN